MKSYYTKISPFWTWWLVLTKATSDREVGLHQAKGHRTRFLTNWRRARSVDRTAATHLSAVSLSNLTPHLPPLCRRSVSARRAAVSCRRGSGGPAPQMLTAKPLASSAGGARPAAKRPLLGAGRFTPFMLGHRRRSYFLRWEIMPVKVTR